MIVTWTSTSAIRRDIHSVRDAKVGGGVEHGRLGASVGDFSAKRRRGDDGAYCSACSRCAQAQAEVVRAACWLATPTLAAPGLQRPGRARYVGSRAPGAPRPGLGGGVGVPVYSRPCAAEWGVRALGRGPLPEHRAARVLLRALGGAQRGVLPGVPVGAGGGAPDLAQLDTVGARRLRRSGLLRGGRACQARRAPQGGAVPADN